MAENSFGAGEIFKLLYENRGRQPIYQPEAENYASPYNGDLQENPIDIMKIVERNLLNMNYLRARHN